MKQEGDVIENMIKESSEYFAEMLDGSFYYFESNVDSINSPIELMLCRAFIALERVIDSTEIQFCTRHLMHGGWKLLDVKKIEIEEWKIYPFRQVSFMDYVADFIAVCKIDGVTDYLCIECDGHDFHERTKNQVARDKLRDRRFLIGGIPAMRFSGSEIWRDPLECGRQVNDFFFNRAAERHQRGVAK